MIYIIKDIFSAFVVGDMSFFIGKNSMTSKTATSHTAKDTVKDASSGRKNHVMIVSSKVGERR